MKQRSIAFLSLNTNAVGTIVIAVLSSLTTVAATSIFGSLGAERQSMELVSSIAAEPSTGSVLECLGNVYSPVQKRCVTQEVFDGEMKRLFAALGIDSSIYGASGETN